MHSPDGDEGRPALTDEPHRLREDAEIVAEIAEGVELLKRLHGHCDDVDRDQNEKRRPCFQGDFAPVFSFYLWSLNYFLLEIKIVHFRY